MSAYLFGEAELMLWLKNNRAHFLALDYSPNEIAHLAILCGFDPASVYRVISNFTDALQGSSIDRRAAFLIDSTVDTIKTMAGLPNLKEHWFELYEKQTHDKDFNEEGNSHA